MAASFGGVRAQGVGTGRELSSTSGYHTISGRVYFPDGASTDVRVKVQLESTGAPTVTTTTNADGAFRFSGLNTGYYTVIVEASERYEVFREKIDIERGNSYSPRNIQIPVYLRLKGTPPVARGVLNAALADVPKPAANFYMKAGEAAAKGDIQKTVDLLNKALEIHPSFFLALSELGVRYLRLNQPDKAEESLRAALKIKPDDVGARLNYGVALLNLKRLNEAETELRAVLKQNEALPTAHMYLGILLMSQKRFDEAEPELLKATAAQTNEVAQAHRYLGGLYWGKRDYQKAVAELETYLRLVPNAADAEKIRGTIKDLRVKLDDNRQRS